jgi:hypothetical protein
MACLSYLGGQPAPVFEAVEGAFDDVASAVGGAVVRPGRPPDEPDALAVGLLVVGLGDHAADAAGF